MLDGLGVFENRSAFVSGWSSLVRKAEEEAIAATALNHPRASAVQTAPNVANALDRTASQRARVAAESDCNNMFYLNPNDSQMNVYDNDYATCIRVHTHELESRM